MSTFDHSDTTPPGSSGRVATSGADRADRRDPRSAGGTNRRQVVTGRAGGAPVRGPDDLHPAEAFDLKSHFPISARLSLKKNLVAALVSVAAVFVYLSLFGVSVPRSSENPVQWAFSLGLRLVLVLTIARFLYWEAWRAAFEYGTEGFRFSVRRGVVIKDQGTTPLAPSSGIFLRRDNLDKLLGLYQVQVKTSVDPHPRFGIIEGLTAHDSRALVDFLSSQVNKQVSAPASSSPKLKAESPLVVEVVGEDDPELFEFEDYGEEDEFGPVYRRALPEPARVVAVVPATETEPKKVVMTRRAGTRRAGD